MRTGCKCDGRKGQPHIGPPRPEMKAGENMPEEQDLETTRKIKQ